MQYINIRKLIILYNVLKKMYNNILCQIFKGKVSTQEVCRLVST